MCYGGSGSDEIEDNLWKFSVERNKDDEIGCVEIQDSGEFPMCSGDTAVAVTGVDSWQ